MSGWAYEMILCLIFATLLLLADCSQGSKLESPPFMLIRVTSEPFVLIYILGECRSNIQQTVYHRKMMLRGTTIKEAKNCRKLANTPTEHLLAQSFLKEDATWPPPEGNYCRSSGSFQHTKIFVDVELPDAPENSTMDTKAREYSPADM